MIRWSSFCFVIHLLKILQEGKYLRECTYSLKIISLCDYVSVCTDGVSPIMRIKRVYEFCEKGKIKIFYLFIVLFIEKIYH